MFYDFIYLRSGPKEKEFCTNSAIDIGKVSEIQHLNKDIIRSLMQLKLHFNKMNFVYRESHIIIMMTISMAISVSSQVHFPKKDVEPDLGK